MAADAKILLCVAALLGMLSGLDGLQKKQGLQSFSI
jgi:hypothetical protein